MDNNNRFVSFLKEKSIEAFLLSIEIFNKPTIKYRLEGCVYSLCNAWELLLKAKLLIDKKDIYYPEKSRTLSIADCVKEVFTNENDPIRQNLMVIIALRNTATHLVIPEYEFSYMPFLSFCVKKYSDKLFEFLGENISTYIKTDFLSLFVSGTAPNKAELLTKYGESLVLAYEKRDSDLRAYFDCEEGMSIAYRVDVNLARINNKSKADYLFYVSNNPKDTNVKYIDRPIDSNLSHTYTHHGIAYEVNTLIKKDSIPFTPIKEPVPTKKNPNPPIFSTACLDVLIKTFKLKENKDFVVIIQNGNQTVCKYSSNLITWIIAKIVEDPNVVVKNKKK